MKVAIQADTEILHLFGAAADASQGIAPRIDGLFRWIARETQRGGSFEKHLPILQFIAMQYSRAWLLVAQLYEESGSAESKEKAKEAVRHFLETASGADAYREWRHLVDLCRHRRPRWRSKRARRKSDTPRCDLRRHHLCRESVQQPAKGPFTGVRSGREGRDRAAARERNGGPVNEASATDLSRLGGYICT